MRRETYQAERLVQTGSLPDETGSEPPDLRRYYEEQSRYIWSLYALALSWLLVSQMVGEAVRKGSFSIGENLFDFAVLASMASMAIVKRRSWHVVALWC